MYVNVYHFLSLLLRPLGPREGVTRLTSRFCRRSALNADKDDSMALVACALAALDFI